MLMAAALIAVAPAMAQQALFDPTAKKTTEVKAEKVEMTKKVEKLDCNKLKCDTVAVCPLRQDCPQQNCANCPQQNGEKVLQQNCANCPQQNCGNCPQQNCVKGCNNPECKNPACGKENCTAAVCGKAECGNAVCNKVCDKKNADCKATPCRKAKNVNKSKK